MGNKSCCIRRRSKQGSKFTPISSYGSQKTGREVSVNFLPHISEREFIEAIGMCGSCINWIKLIFKSFECQTFKGINGQRIIKQLQRSVFSLQFLSVYLIGRMH
uniref:Uncharacterized protein n=1 Tax=Acrobeloides nanus TaxID=290746 RepID=A0A914BZF1_9BILA